MENWTRREFVKATARASAGLAVLRAGQLLFVAAQSESSSAQPHSAEFRSNTRWRSLLDSDCPLRRRGGCNKRFRLLWAVAILEDWGHV